MTGSSVKKDVIKQLRNGAKWRSEWCAKLDNADKISTSQLNHGQRNFLKITL